MSEYDDLAWLGGGEGYRVGSVEREGGERPRIWISLTPPAFGEMICEACSGQVRALHDIVYRQVRDLPILDNLEATLGPIDLSGVEVIAMDEFAIHKGHR